MTKMLRQVTIMVAIGGIIMIMKNTVPNLTIGQKLKMFREFNNMSQEQLGQKLGKLVKEK